MTNSADVDTKRDGGSRSPSWRRSRHCGDALKGIYLATSNELEDLEALLGSEGFARWRDHIVNEWGPAGERFQQAVKQAAVKEDTAATNHLRAVLFAQSEIEKLLVWPIERMRQIQHQAPVQSGPSRRGSL
jgi:hypothetical protein